MAEYNKESVAENWHKYHRLDDFLQKPLMRNVTGEQTESKQNKWHDNFAKGKYLPHFASPQEFMMARFGYAVHLRVNGRLTENESWNTLFCILNDARVFGFPFAVIADSLKRSKLATKHDQSDDTLKESNWIETKPDKDGKPSGELTLYSEEFRQEVRSYLSPAAIIASMSEHKFAPPPPSAPRTPDSNVSRQWVEQLVRSQYGRAKGPGKGTPPKPDKGADKGKGRGKSQRKGARGLRKDWQKAWSQAGSDKNDRDRPRDRTNDGNRQENRDRPRNDRDRDRDRDRPRDANKRKDEGSRNNDRPSKFRGALNYPLKGNDLKKVNNQCNKKKYCRNFNGCGSPGGCRASASNPCQWTDKCVLCDGDHAAVSCPLFDSKIASIEA
jgi:hypothetical protein